MLEQAPSSIVTVLVVTWNGEHLLRPCLQSLRAQSFAHHVLVVDNASSDATTVLLAEEFDEMQRVRLDTNTGFAGAMAAALPLVKTPYLALLNNDAVADPGWLRALINDIDSDPGCAAVTSRILLAEDGRINNAGGALTSIATGYDRGYGEPNDSRFDEPVQVAALCGGAAALRTSAIAEVGGVPAEFFMYYEDTDLSWRLRRAGYSIRYCPAAVVSHLHSASSDKSSASFAYFNQRNQLLTVIRNAQASVVARSVTRFLAVTAVDCVAAGVARVRRRRVAVAHQRSPSRRLKVLAGVLAQLPAAIRCRRATAKLPISRRQFDQEWLGVESRPL
jgi:GT2 family glycosyltransferase